VQHVGGWLLLSMVCALGLHDAVQQGWEVASRFRKRLRVALDAVVLALGLGQRCVEGVLTGTTNEVLGGRSTSVVWSRWC